MSINVTVSGNPIRISRCKMLKGAFDPSKQEFEKRRLIRLEQVRQQSKDIAENIRNKVKTDKSKRLSNAEKEGAIKLENWQAKKLLQLQNQYQEALDNIGLGHRQVESVEEDDEIYAEQLKANEEASKERGRLAANRLQVENNERNLKKAIPIQRKKMTRDAENERAAVISGRKAKSPMKKGRKSVEEAFDSDSENRIPQLFDITEESGSRSPEHSGKRAQSASSGVSKMSKEQQTSLTLLNVPKSDKIVQTNLEEIKTNEQSNYFPKDTRISDRIKSRAISDPQPDYCVQYEKEFGSGRINETAPVKCNCCQCPERPGTSRATHTDHRPIESENNLGQYRFPETDFTNQNRETFPESDVADKYRRVFSKTEPDAEISRTNELRQNAISQHINPAADLGESPGIRSHLERTKDIPSKTKKINDPIVTEKAKHYPTKPKITLRSAKVVPEIKKRDTLQGDKIRYYDHPNRFSKDYVSKTSLVDKVTEADLFTSPILSDDGMAEKIKQRDLEAQLRGQAAMEKEKIQREYKDLLRKLPVLQKQERIGEIGRDKEKYHMSYDRLDEMNRKRQNRLDNAYEEVMVRSIKPAVITLHKKGEKSERNDVPTLNLAGEDGEAATSRDLRTNELSSLLTKLKHQKSDLMKDIEKTLSHETVQQLSKLLSQEEIKLKRKRSRDERPLSPSSESETGDFSSMKSFESLSSAPVIVPSPRKKAKLRTSKPQILVLQNVSTQTSPAVGRTSPVVEKRSESELKDVKSVTPPVSGRESQKEAKVVKPAPDPAKIPESEPKVVKPKPISKPISTSTVRKPKKIVPKHQNSWRHELTNPSLSSNSTSYYDPPDPANSTMRTDKSFASARSAKDSSRSIKDSSKSTKDSSKSFNSTVSAYGEDGKQIDPRLLKYIQKLLDMSRANIDDLTVSGVSEVSTPNQSVVEMPSNNPLAQLKNVIRYFNLDATEVQKQLASFSSNESRGPNSTTTTNKSNITSSSEELVVHSMQASEDAKNKLVEYADVAADCTRKISNLTAMIEKVRAEKKNLLETTPNSGSEKDYSTTSYLDLPDKKDKSGEKQQPKDTTDSGSEETDGNLFGIDYSYAEKLKELTPAEIAKEKQKQPSNEELLGRLKNLLAEPVQQIQVEETPQQDFIPMLDIKKLPKFEQVAVTSQDNNGKRKPPPSKGLRIFNGDVPHELSTIVEADSQLSAKLDSPTKGGVIEESPRTDKSGSSSVPDLLTEVPHNSNATSTNNSSEDKSEMETMETMLQSIGMEWAIPTLRKTREALALSSSDSTSGSKKEDLSQSKNDVSLKEFLSKISSSKSEGSSESQEISIINRTTEDRKTSTPVQGARLDNIVRYGQPNFLQDSDISSVKDHSGLGKDRSEESSEKFYDLNETSTSKSR